MPLELTPEAEAEMIAEAKERQRRVMDEIMRECDSWVQAMKPAHEIMIANIRQYEGMPRGLSPTKREHSGPESAGPPTLRATRSKTDLVEARICDMLLPSSQASWRFEPEPQQDSYLFGEEGGPDFIPPEAREQFVTTRVNALTKLIKDQLYECDFARTARKVIEDACRPGWGVFIAPVNTIKRREKYRRVEVPQEPTGLLARLGQAVGFHKPQVQVEIKVEIESEVVPAVKYGDPFMFFPQPVENLDDARGAYYLELMTESGLRELAMSEDADQGAISELIATKKIDHGIIGAQIIERWRSIGFDEDLTGRFPVWRYTGTLTHAQMTAINGCECDPLEPTPMIDLYFCLGKKLILRECAIQHNRRIPYYVYAPVREVGSWRGLGIPWLCRDSARAAQAAYEIALHNAAVSAGPIVFYRGKLIPADKIMEIRGPKFIKVDDGQQSMQDMLHVEIVPNKVEEALMLMDRALAQMDDDINLPQFTNPEVNKPIQTANGFANWMNAQTVVQRRWASAWDDCVGPMMKAMVQWNRKYSDDPEIQVDVQVVPLGQSEMIVKDMQVQNALSYMSMAQAGPLANITDMDALGRHIAQKFDLPDSVIMSPEQAAERAQNQPQDPAMMAEQAKLQLAQGELQLQQQKLAAETADKERDDNFRREDRELDHEERMRELAIKERQQQLDAFKIREQIQLKLMELQQKAELSREDMQLKVAMAEMDRDLAQYQTSFKGTIEAQKLATSRSEMALKLSPANPTNTGI